MRARFQAGLIAGIFLTGNALVGPGTAIADTLDALAEATAESRQASQIVRQLQSDPQTRLLDVLTAMQGKTATAKNWYLSVAQTVADRDPQQARAELGQFLTRLSEDPDARYWALRYITQGDVGLREQYLEAMLADPSPDIRYEAVALGLRRAGENTELPAQAKQQRYQELLAAARLPEQIREVAKRLKDECEYEVDLLQFMGFVSRWHTVGPFDNQNQSAFDVAYAPEKDYAAGKLDLDGSYSGKTDGLKWQLAETQADDGAVDLNPVYDNEKGAIAYLSTNFNSPAELEGEVRIGTPNACKVWVNGELLISREVYHSGSQIDQYVAPVKLRAGANSILLKLCQNEQTESWAQDWSFQLRFTDSDGVAVQPAD
ncbi:MAG: hypothetical protein NXI32_22800 [bacterium]|nr:hypothetical protein [bacterium]